MKNQPNSMKEIGLAITLGMLSFLFAIGGSLGGAIIAELPHAGNVFTSSENILFAVQWGACWGLLFGLTTMMLKLDRSTWVGPRPLLFLWMMFFTISCVTHAMFIIRTAWI